MRQEKINVPNSFQLIFQLSAVSRFSRDHMLKPESVLEHIGFSCIYATLLAERLRIAGFDIDMHRLMCSVAFHDIEEGITGDVPRVTKYFDKGMRESFSRMEHFIIDRLDKWLGVKISGYWINAKKVGIEGQILRVTDIAAVVFKNWVEVSELGNQSFMRVVKETNEVIGGVVKEDFVDLLKEELQTLFFLNDSIISGLVYEADMFKEMKRK